MVAEEVLTPAAVVLLQRVLHGLQPQPIEAHIALWVGAAIAVGRRGLVKVCHFNVLAAHRSQRHIERHTGPRYCKTSWTCTNSGTLSSRRTYEKPSWHHESLNFCSSDPCMSEILQYRLSTQHVNDRAPLEGWTRRSCAQSWTVWSKGAAYDEAIFLNDHSFKMKARLTYTQHLTSCAAKTSHAHSRWTLQGNLLGRGRIDRGILLPGSCLLNARCHHALPDPR